MGVLPRPMRLQGDTATVAVLHRGMVDPDLVTPFTARSVFHQMLAGPQALADDSAAQSAAMVNINTADAAELAAGLKGVGQSRAEAIKGRLVPTIRRLSGVGPWPGTSDDRVRVELHTAVLALVSEASHLAALSVFEHDRFVALTENPTVTPLAECAEHHPQVTPLLGQHVVVPAATLVVRPTIQHPCNDEFVEPIGQDIPGNPEAVHEVVETSNPEHRVAQDQECPPLADDFERLSYRAVHAEERRFPHHATLPELHHATYSAIASCMMQLTARKLDRTALRRTPETPTEQPRSTS